MPAPRTRRYIAAWPGDDAPAPAGRLPGLHRDFTGAALRDGYREKVILATKAPTWLYRCPEDFDRYLDIQLERLGTDHVDVYLLHGMNRGSWNKTVLRYDVLRKAEEARAAGKIRFLGFSFHDDLELFQTILESHPTWDLCQIQLNYMDTEFQAGLAGLELAARRGLGVVIMEPLRGGYLARRLPETAERIFRAARPERTSAQWAFDFLWDRPEVSVVLSGMGAPEEVAENVDYARQARPGMLAEAEREVYRQVKECLASYPVIPCTGCAYCMHCPKHIAIPYNFMVYNEYQTNGDLESARTYYHKQLPPFGAKAEKCIGCKTCEELCPQHIPISTWMPKIAALLGDT